MRPSMTLPLSGPQIVISLSCRRAFGNFKGYARVKANTRASRAGKSQCWALPSHRRAS